MDVNGSRFQLLLGYDDWSRCTDEAGTALADLWEREQRERPADWDAARSELILRAGIFEFPPTRADRPPRPTDRRGAARDRYGSFYWIDEGRTRILVESVGSGQTSVFWDTAPRRRRRRRTGDFGPAEPGPGGPFTLAGLAVTEDHYLVAGVVDAPGLLVFDLQSGGPPTRLAWPAGVAFRPLDLSSRPGGGVFVLDAENRRAWELDRRLQVVPARAPLAAEEAPGSFRPAEGEGERAVGSATGAALAAEDATSLADAVDPVAVEGAPDCSILVLDRNPGGRASLVRRYRGGVEPALPALLEELGIGVGVFAHDMALVPSAEKNVLGTLYVADERGDQAYAFTVRLGMLETLRLALERAFYPMRMFGGKGLVAGPERAYYDFGDRWLPLVAQPRHRFEEAGTIVTPELDGHEPAGVWHRLLFDACLPPGTGLAVWSAAAEAVDELAVAEWRREPEPRRRPRGLELPFAADRQGAYDTYELLFQRAKGRFLRLKIELQGDGRASPRLRALRAWYPRFSYLTRYLPAVYREEPDSASFLDRFLANLEGFHTEIEGKVAAAQILLDPRIAPPGALDWLAGFFGAALDPAWDEARRRLFIRHASSLFRLRGTMRGIELALRLTLDPCVDERLFAEVRHPALRGPRIVEAYRTRKTPGVVLGDPTDLGLPRLVARERRWDPAEGRAGLDERWRDYLARAGIEVAADAAYPAGAPSRRRGALWREFSRDVLGFLPGRVDDVDAWQEFLARRYANVGALNVLYGLTGGARLESFADAELPEALPPDGPPLVDWYQFHSVVVPMRRKAHRFTVLLPLRVRGDSAAAERLRALAERLVELQKPAHTTFDVKFFWSAFRVGEARLGTDTLMGQGSRAPELLGPAVLGTDYVGESVLGGRIASDTVRRPDPEPPASEETP